MTEITYSWQIGPLDCAPHVEGKADVVQTIHWRLIGTDGTNEAQVYGTASIPAPADGAAFTPYDQITEAEATGWLSAALAEQLPALHDNIAGQIAALVSPPIVSKATPWNS